MSILDGNLAALAARFPGLAERIAASPEESGFSAFSARNGELTASLGAAALHSRYDPGAEARKTAAALPEGTDLCLVYGFGLGCLEEALLASDPDLLVLVLEREAAALRSALSVRDLSALLSSERLSFVLGGGAESLIHALDGLRPSRPIVLRNPARVAADPPFWAACDEAFRRWEAKRGINEATLRRFGPLWIRNLGKNLERLGRDPGIMELAGLCGPEAGSPSGAIPALIAAAGPSLDRVLPRIRDIARRALIVAVDTSARLVQEAGVDPDFVVTADPQYWNSRHLDRFDARRSFLVAEAAVHPRAFSLPWRGVFLSASIFPLARFVEERSAERGRLGAGGSVSTTAWDFARHLGCSPLWLAGLDLGFPGLATHASGSFFEERALRSSDRLQPAQTAAFHAAHSAEPFLAPDASGGRILTDRRMRLYAWWFESRLASTGHPSKSLSPQGLALQSLPLGNVEDLAGAGDRREKIDRRLRSVEGMSGPGEAFDCARKELLEELGAISAAAASALGASEEALRRLSRGQGGKAELAALEKADRALLASEARDIISFLFPNVEELFARKPSSLEEALRSGMEIYGEIQRQADFHLAILGGRRREPLSKLG